MTRSLLIALLFLTACEKASIPEATRPVKAIQVKESTTSEGSATFPGTLRAFKRADLSFRVDGVVQTRDITVGQQVKSGGLLIQLDPRDYEVALQKAKGKVASTQAQLDFASRDYDRMEKIYETDPGAISASLLDRKKENRNQLQAELEVAQSDLEKASDDLSYTTLRAPFDAVVAAIYVEKHEQVRAKQTVVRLIDTGEGEMEINVPEKFMASLLKGRADLQFDVYLDAFPNRVFLAHIKEIGTEASSTTQTYPVTLSLHHIPTELSLLAGMSGHVIARRPSDNTKPNVQIYEIPKTALFTDNLNHSYVWVVDPQTQVVSKRQVTVEDNYRGTQAVIRDGVHAGEWIVTAGTGFLSEGQHVRLLKE